MATVGGSSRLEGVKSAVIAGISVAVCVDGQLKVGDPILESGECVCV